jgi:ABC-type transport system involved in multi-copper enzyme maturation permease subunit
VKDINDQMIALQYLYQFNMRIYSNKHSYRTPINSGDNLIKNNDYYTCSLTSDNKCSINNHDKDDDISHHNYGNDYIFFE